MKWVRFLIVLVLITVVFASVTTWDTVKLFEDDYWGYLAVMTDSTFKVLWTGTAANGSNSNSVLIKIGVRRPLGYLNSERFDYKDLVDITTDTNGIIALVDSSWWKKQAPDAFKLQVIDSVLTFTSEVYFLDEDLGNLTVYWRSYDMGSGGDQNKISLGFQIF
jgi:hypothetical protein